MGQSNQFFSQANYLAQYQFVKMPIFFKCGCEGKLVMLVDENYWIHDYKITFSKVCITEYTTQSHFVDKTKNKSFIFRNKLLKILGLNHYPNIEQNKRKKYIQISEKNQIVKVNYLFNNEWSLQTFPNIDYVFTGSNPSGGMGTIKNSTYWTIFKNGEKKFPNFTLQSLQLSKVWQQYHSNNFYKEIWQNCDNALSLEEWINNNHMIKKDFDWFNNSDFHPNNEWKQKYKETKNRFCKKREIYESVLSLCLKYRNEIIRTLKKDKKIFINNFWNNDFSNVDIIEFAHIKPVYLIKKQFLNSNNNQILEQIKDKHNIIPITPDIHTMYDKGFIYWSSQDGKLKLIKNISYIPNNIFDKIPQKTLQLIQPFLKEYEQLCLQNLFG